MNIFFTIYNIQYIILRLKNMELQNNSNIVETFATELNSMADSLEALVIGNQNMFVESGQNNNSLSNTTINPSQRFIPIDNTNLIPPSNVLPSPSPNSPNPSLDIVSAATDENNNEQEPEIGHNSIGHNSNDVEASEEIYNESLNDREFFTMMSTLIENRNRNMDNIPIKFMTIISKFVIDPDAECLRIPRERDHNNNEMNHVREFNRIIDCSYCGERIVNYFNNYMQHIIDKDHVLEQDNTNNIMTNLLQNNNVQQNSQNINDQYVNITNNEERKCNFKSLEGKSYCKRHIDYQRNNEISEYCCGISYMKKPHISLYGEKIKLLEYLDYRSIGEEINNKLNCTLPVDLKDKFFVPSNYSLKSKLDWFAGYCDGDGSIAKNDTNQAMQISCIHKEFLLKIKYTLSYLSMILKMKVKRP